MICIYFFSDDICEYFGVKIGMYFAWLGHYTAALSIPAIVGLMFWVKIKNKTLKYNYNYFFIPSYVAMESIKNWKILVMYYFRYST